MRVPGWLFSLRMAPIASTGCMVMGYLIAIALLSAISIVSLFPAIVIALPLWPIMAFFGVMWLISIINASIVFNALYSFILLPAIWSSLRRFPILRDLLVPLSGAAIGVLIFWALGKDSLWLLYGALIAATQAYVFCALMRETD